MNEKYSGGAFLKDYNNYDSLFEQLSTKKSEEEILDTIDINIIEKYLRKKKLERLNNK